MLQNIFRNMPPVVKNLLLINVVMFVLSIAFPVLGNQLALYNITSDFFRPFQIVTHFFMHGGIGHIFFNMFALVMFGSQLERVWGPKRFLFFYLFSAIGAFLLQAGVNYYQYYEYFKDFSPQEIEQISQIASQIEYGKRYPIDAIEYYKINYTPMVGASGAIMGLLAAFAFLFPNTELMLIFLPIPVKAKYFVPFYMLIELFLAKANFQWDNIAHYAHLGGALFGLLLVFIWQKNKNSFY